MRVIGIVGLPGSGKSEAANVARDLGIAVVTMGDVIREECRARSLDPSEHHGRVASLLREEEGQAAIAERSLPLIEEALQTHGTVLVDGIRSGAEVEAFEESFGDDFVLLRVDAPSDARAARIDDRGRDDPVAETLAAREARELGFGMDVAMEQADIVIRNNDSLDAFQQRVREYLAAKHDGDDDSSN